MTKIRGTHWRAGAALVIAGHALWLVQACSSNAEDSAAADAGVSETGGLDATSGDVADGSSNDGGGIAVADASADVVEAGAGPFVVPVDVVGVKGTGLVLQNNGGDDLAVLPNDGGTQTVSFATKIDLGKGYTVTVKTQPSSPAQTCSVVGGNGAAVGVPIAGITVTCVSPDARTYFGACLTQLAFGNADKVFRFYVETSSTPSGGGGQTMTWKMTPLSLGPDAGPPASFTTAATVGTTTTVPGVAVASTGAFVTALGTLTIPGAANPITGRDVVIQTASLSGKLETPTFCARLAGDVVQPISLTLDPAQNPCVFLRTADGDPVPTVTSQTFASVCPAN